MEVTSKPAQILTAYDFSETAELALAHTLDLATQDVPREFHCLVVLDPHKGLGLKHHEEVNFAYTEEVQKLATKSITDNMAKLKHDGAPEILVHVRIGDPAKEVLTLAKEIGASLIILGSHGRKGVKRLLLGSVSERVAREALCPVLVTRDRTYQDVEREHIVPAKESEHGPQYVPPQRFHYNSTAPRRSKAWALY